MGKWIAITGAAIVSVFLYAIAHISATSIDDDMQEMLDEEQTRIVSEMLREKKEKRGKTQRKKVVDKGSTK